MVFKKIFVLSLFSVLCTLIYSQGNLQFNQVIYQTLTGVSANTGTSAPDITFQTLDITVPFGKVWKIETASCKTELGLNNETKIGGNNSNDNIFIFLDQDILCYVINSNNLVGFISQTHLPLWLPSGTYTLRLKGKCAGQYSKYTAYGSIHAIEFNIIP